MSNEEYKSRKGAMVKFPGASVLVLTPHMKSVNPHSRAYISSHLGRDLHGRGPPIYSSALAYVLETAKIGIYDIVCFMPVGRLSFSSPFAAAGYLLSLKYHRFLRASVLRPNAPKPCIFWAQNCVEKDMMFEVLPRATPYPPLDSTTRQ